MSKKHTPATTAEELSAAAEPGLDEEELDEEEAAAAAPAPRPTRRTPARPQPRAAQAAAPRQEHVGRNVLFCLVGLIVGFGVGFFLATKLIPDQRALTTASANAPAQAEADGTAPPLDPSQTTGQLPPGHPDIGGAKEPTSAAANSADAQQAMAAADAQPKDFDLQMNAAAVFYRAGDYDKAQLYLERAVALRPKDVDALTALGNTKYDKNDFAGAAAEYQRVLVVNPNDVDVQTDLGNTFFRRTPPDYQRAIAEYRKTLAVNPKHEKALQNIVAAALELKDKATANTALNQLAAADPNNPALAELRQRVSALP
ncbi:MAG TPA: tetratricopeptide repeat protein [Pyrinomonadaceae bacterium]|jgi:tetratricopeptide (TPR) repeat protein